MGILQNNISAISNINANQGIQLVVRAESAMGSRRASILRALPRYASHLHLAMRDALRHWPCLFGGMKSSVGTAGCFATTKQGQRQRVVIDCSCRPVC